MPEDNFFESDFLHDLSYQHINVICVPKKPFHDYIPPISLFLNVLESTFALQFSPPTLLNLSWHTSSLFPILVLPALSVTFDTVFHPFLRETFLLFIFGIAHS